MRRTVRDAVLVTAVCLAAFFTNLGGTRLWDRDEPRNAGCAAEMLAANDWVTPIFNAELRPHKPVLTYWFMMISYSLWGVTEFAARFSSALLGLGTCLLTWFIGRRLFGPQAGLWAAVAMATTLMFGVASRAATPDAPLIFFSTLAMAIYVAGVTGPCRAIANGSPDDGGCWKADYPEQWSTVFLMYAAMGGAVLAKGPVGLVLPTAVIGMFLLIRRLPAIAEASAGPRTWRSWGLGLLRPFAPEHFLRTCWAMRPITAVAAAGLVALPWYLWVHLRTNGEWTNGFFVVHNLERATRAMDGHNFGPIFYPVALLFGFFPWSVFWLPALIDGVRRFRATLSPAYLLAFCWVGVYLGLFSLAKTKLPSYVTPCYPGLALLTGVFVARASAGMADFGAIWRRLAFGTLMAVGLGIAIALPILAHLFLPGEEFLGLLGAVPLIGGTVALALAEKHSPRQAFQVTLGTSFAFVVLLFAVVAARIDRHRHIEDLVAAIYGETSPDQFELASLARSEASWVFYCGRPIRPIEPEDVDEFLAPDGGRPRALLTTRKKLAGLADKVDITTYPQARVPYFMRGDEIVIVKPRLAPLEMATPSESNSRR